MLTRKNAAKAYRTLKLSAFRRRGRTEVEAFEAAVAAAEDKDHILVFTCRWYMRDVRDWYTHPHGVVVRYQYSKFFLNGVEPRDDRRDEAFFSVPDHPDEGTVQASAPRSVAEHGYTLLLNGRTLYAGPADELRSHRHGALIRIGDEYRLIVAKKFDPDAVIC